MINFILSWGLIFLSAICDVSTMIFVKKRYIQIGNFPLDSLPAFFKYLVHFFSSPLSIIFLCLFFASPFLWFIALNRINLSIGYPVSIGIRLILVFLSSYLLLGEGLNFQKILALFLIFFSLYLFYRS